MGILETMQLFDYIEALDITVKKKLLNNYK